MTYQDVAAAGAHVPEIPDIASLEAEFRDNPPRSRYADLSIARLAQQAKLTRAQFFNSQLFSDPAWDMLLELYTTTLVERKLSVSRLAERTGLPSTTTLRWLAALEREQLVERSEHPFDRRQVLLSLSEKGCSAMASFFNSLEDESRIF